MTQPTESASIPPWLVLVGVLAAGVTLLGAHALAYPITGASAADLAAVAAPDPRRVLAMLRSLCWLALINASAWSVGALIESRLQLPPSVAALRWIFRLGIGLGLLAPCVLALAALQILVMPAFAALLVTPIAIWSIRWWLDRGSMGSSLAWSRPSRALALAAAAYGLLLFAAYLGALGADVGWDALTYHLAFPARYLDENRIVMTSFSHLSGYIASTEMLYLLALALDGTGLAVLINFEFGLLVLAATFVYARQVSLRAAVLAPLFLLADPLFQHELGWAYTDLSLAFYTTLGAIALLAWLEDADSRGALLHAGLFLGFACATRYLAASIGVMFVALVWLPPRHRRVRENLGASALLAGMSLLVLLPWLLRNAIFTGNPVTPLLQSILHAPGAEYIPPIVMEQSAGFLRFVGMGRDLPALLALPWNLVVESVPGTYAESFGFQVGPLYVVGLVAALLVGEARRSSVVSSLSKGIGVFVLLWFYSFQEARFLVPVFPMLAIVGAIGLDRAAGLSKPWGRVVLLLPIVAAIQCQLALFAALPADYAFALGSPAAGVEEERGAVAAASFLRDEMGEEDRLMLWLEERAFLFRGLDYIPYHIGSGSPSLHFVHGYPHGAALHCGLQALGVTHVLLNRNFRQAAPGLYVDGYGQAEFIRDLNRVENLMRYEASRVFEKDGVEVHRLPRAPCD